jgi:hypothetical protein
MDIALLALWGRTIPRGVSRKTMQLVKTVLTLMLAWVLWEKVFMQGYAEPPFQPIDGFIDKPACEQAAKNKSAVKLGKLPDGGEIQSLSPYGFMTLDAQGKVKVMFEYRCLPESVDPRR